jgi:hypothetical protein
MPVRSVTSRAVMVLILVSQLVVLPLRSQAANTKQGTRDVQSLITIQNALAALGGVSNIALIQNSVAQGTSVAVPDNGAGPTTFTWTYSGSDFRNENDAARGSHIFLSNSGSPCDLQGSQGVPYGEHVARANLPFHVPGLVLLSELNNLNYTLTYIGTATINGVAAVHIQTSDNSDQVGQSVTPQDWYFDATSGIPLRVEFRVPDPTDAQTWSPASMDFANFQTINGILVPFQLAINEGPISLATTVTSLTFNTAIDPSEFNAPCGGGQ